MFQKPTLEEVEEYCNARGNSIDPEHFWVFYEARNWYVGRHKMHCWKSAVILWEKQQRVNENNKPVTFIKKTQTHTENKEENLKRQSDYLLKAISRTSNDKLGIETFVNCMYKLQSIFCCLTDSAVVVYWNGLKNIESYHFIAVCKDISKTYDYSHISKFPSINEFIQRYNNLPR